MAESVRVDGFFTGIVMLGCGFDYSSFLVVNCRGKEDKEGEDNDVA